MGEEYGLPTLILAATAVPWLTGSLARRRESRFAAARGDLAAAVVDQTGSAMAKERDCGSSI